MALSTSNITSGFIDLATFDEIEKYMYGGADATAYFVRETRKSTWFTQVPVTLSKASGQAEFGQEWAVSISRAGDYLLNAWLRLELSNVTKDSTSTTIRWTRNLMHNLVQECSITFNDLVAARFDSAHLDFWSAFTVPAGKQDGYNQMIGNTYALTAPQTSLPAAAVVLPLPLFFTRDSGVALPTAALPYNEMRINFSFRKWEDLIVTENSSTAAYVSTTAVSNTPSITSANVWANYAIVSNDERKRMACAPRDILIEQVQTAPKQSFNPGSSSSQTILNYDIRFSHAVKVLFFGVRNKTSSDNHDWSNYTTDKPGYSSSNNAFTLGKDPIDRLSLVYENTNRLSQMIAGYFSLVNPYYNAPVIPKETGYHMYSYSLDFISLDPMGSTNFGKLTNVSVAVEPSTAAKDAASRAPNANPPPQTFEFLLTAVNNNIIRISGGALGFPVL
jgi:hypothetical protein